MKVRDQHATNALNVEEMRQAFDQMFAAPDLAKPVDLEDFLAIRVGTRPFALRVSELAWIEFGRRIVALPGGDPWLVGITNSRGKLIPVHSLELALGFDRTAGEKGCLAICGRDEPLGLAFDALEGYLRLPRSEVFSTGAAESARKTAQHAVRGGGGLRPVVHLPSLLEAVRERVVSKSIGEA